MFDSCRDTDIVYLKWSKAPDWQHVEFTTAIWIIILSILLYYADTLSDMNGLQCIHLDKKLAGPKLEFLIFE